MKVMLFSPIVYGWVRCLRQYGMIVVGFLWVMGWWIDVPGFSLTAFFFFSIGALSGKRFSGGEQLLCLCLSWDAVGVGYQGRGSVSPSGV